MRLFGRRTFQAEEIECVRSLRREGMRNVPRTAWEPWAWRGEGVGESTGEIAGAPE